MRRASSSNGFEVVVKAPTLGLYTRIPGEQPDPRAATEASNVRFAEGVAMNAPGYGVLVTNPVLPKLPVLFQQIVFERGGMFSTSVIIGTKNKLYSLFRYPESYSPGPPVPGSPYQFVACCQWGSASSGDLFIGSDDGVTWGVSASPGEPIDSFNSVVSGESLFVAVGYAGISLTTRTVIATSSDGRTWTREEAPIDHDWSSVCYGNGVFVAVARDTVTSTGQCMVRESGIWNSYATPSDASWTHVCYEPTSGNFVAAGENESGIVVFMYSSDLGHTWTKVTTVVPNYPPVCGISGYDGVVVALTQQKTFRSTNGGASWSITDTFSTFLSSAMYPGYLIHNGSEFLYSGYESEDASKIVSSPDGATWSAATDNFHDDGSAVRFEFFGTPFDCAPAFKSGIYVGFRASSGTARVFVSADTVEWVGYTATVPSEKVKSVTAFQ